MFPKIFPRGTIRNMKPEMARKILEETKRNFDRIAEEFSESRREPWEIMKSFLRYLREGDKVLDIGCGNGRVYDLLKEKNIDYIGIDNSEKLIEIAREKFEILNSKSETNSKFKIQNSKFQFLVADALDFPFQNEEFDAVFMIAVLPHIPSKEFQIKALENAYRVLKRNGNLFLTCWNLWQPKLFWQNFKNRLKNKKIYRGLGFKDFFIPWKMKTGEIIQRFYRLFTKNELRKILEKSGFKIQDIYYEYQGKKSNWLRGFNLVALAKK